MLLMQSHTSLVVFNKNKKQKTEFEALLDKWTWTNEYCVVWVLCSHFSQYGPHLLFTSKQHWGKCRNQIHFTNILFDCLFMKCPAHECPGLSVLYPVPWPSGAFTSRGILRKQACPVPLTNPYQTKLLPVYLWEGTHPPFLYTDRQLPSGNRLSANR